MNQENLALSIIAMEKAALEEWNKGNPSGFLSIYAEDLTYIDPVQRLRGFEKIKELYESIRGNIQVDKYEMIDPVVQISGETAVLSYLLESHPAEDKPSYWNCTAVYQQHPDMQWKIIHNHWSLSQNKV